MNGSYLLTLDNTKRYNKPSLFMKWPGHQLVIKSAKYTLSTRQYRPCMKKRPPNFLHFHIITTTFIKKYISSYIHVFHAMKKFVSHIHKYTHTQALLVWQYQNTQNTKLAGCVGLGFDSSALVSQDIILQMDFKKIITLIKTLFTLLHWYWFHPHLSNFCSPSCLPRAASPFVGRREHSWPHAQGSALKREVCERETRNAWDQAPAFLSLLLIRPTPGILGSTLVFNWS